MHLFFIFFYFFFCPVVNPPRSPLTLQQAAYLTPVPRDISLFSSSPPLVHLHRHHRVFVVVVVVIIIATIVGEPLNGVNRRPKRRASFYAHEGTIFRLVFDAKEQGPSV